MRQNETEKRQFLLLFLFPLLADGFFASVRTNFIFMIADPVLSLPAPPKQKRRPDPTRFTPPLLCGRSVGFAAGLVYFDFELN